MKMRKRIAALIAVAMIAALMPMTAFAASTNEVTNTVTGKTDETIETNAPELKIAMKHDLTTGVSFYVNLTGAEWPASVTATTQEEEDVLKTDRLNDTTLAISAKNDVVKAKDEVITITMKGVKLTGGEATVEVESAGTAISSSTHVFANASDDAATKVVVDDASSFADNSGGAAKITLTEPFKGAYKGKTRKERTFTIELRDPDFSFEATNYKAETADDGEEGTRLLGSKGFSDFKVKGASSDYDGNDGRILVKDDEITVTIPETNATQPGVFELVGVKISAKRGATKGPIAAVVRGHLIDGAQSVVLAKYADFTTKLEMKKEYEVLTGKSVEVEFTLSEEIADSLLTNRSLDFTLSNGAKFEYDDGKGIVVTPKAKATLNVGSDKDATDELSPVVVKWDHDDYGRIELDGLKLKAGEKAEYKVEATILVPNNFKGDEVLLVAEGRALTDKHEVVAAKVKKALDIEVTPIDIKVGLQKQVGGKIVIKESEKEIIKRNYEDVQGRSHTGAEIIISIDENYDGLRITDADIEVTDGDIILDLDNKVVSGGRIAIPVKRQSTEPSTIEITNIEVTANRMVPEGTYDVKIGGTALTDHLYAREFGVDKAFKDDVSKNSYTREVTVDDTTRTETVNYYHFFDSVVAEKFINITTKNTEDFAPGAGAKVVSFVIGNNKFIADGVEVEMDAAPYIKDGRTMVPVRYLATALGIKENAIKFDAGLVTIFKNDGTILQLQVGSKNLVANGMTIPMVAAAEIIDGRTYVPVTEIGLMFGVSGSWDSATQTATFK